MRVYSCCRLLRRHNLKNQLKCQISAPPRNHKSSVGKLQAEDQPLVSVGAYVSQQGEQKHGKNGVQRHAAVMQLKSIISTLTYQMYGQGWEKSKVGSFSTGLLEPESNF